MREGRLFVLAIVSGNNAACLSRVHIILASLLLKRLLHGTNLNKMVALFKHLGLPRWEEK
jgi:hypothetical protein